MATTFQRTKSDVNPGQLQVEINNDPIFTATCIGIDYNLPDQLTLNFNTDLTGAETTQMDARISSHTPDTIKVSSAALPISDIDGVKIAVHPSYKPAGNLVTYAVWTGAGDDISQSPQGLGEGELLNFSMLPGSPNVVEKDVKFDPAHGKIWIHEGYLKFTNGGAGDHICAVVVAEPSQVQSFVDKVLYIEDNWIKYAPPGSPSIATHGWGGTPVLIPRSYSKDGDWDYSEATGLVPNFTGTGGYKISDIERLVHRFINRIPCYGNCATYFSMTSDETTELPLGYFLRISCFNNSGNTWYASVLMEIYRERTNMP